MKKHEKWKSFDMCQELHISGAFIYNGLREFHEMRTLQVPEQVFNTLYNLSVGFERLIKIAIVLIEHSNDCDQETFEKSLISHSHIDLIERVKEENTDLLLHSAHNRFLHLLTTFYKTTRYGRFNLTTTTSGKEVDMLFDFLRDAFPELKKTKDDFFPVLNETKFKKHIGKVARHISENLYSVIHEKASKTSLFTYELRYGSKAEKAQLSS